MMALQNYNSLCPTEVRIRDLFLLVVTVLMFAINWSMSHVTISLLQSGFINFGFHTLQEFVC